MSEQVPDSSPLSSVPESSPHTINPVESKAFEQPSSTKSCPEHEAEPPVSPAPQPPAAEYDEYAIPVSPSSSTETTLKRAHDDDDDDEEPAPKKTARKPARKGKTAPKKRTIRQTASKEPASATEEATTTPPKRKPRAKPPPKEPTAPSRARSSRTRKAPERFEDTQVAPTPAPAAAKKSASKVFDPTYITTNSASRLVTADAYHMLLTPSAWTCLTPSQQHELVAMLPSSATNTALLARIDAGDTQDTRPREFTMANDCFRTDVAKFQADLRNGHLAKTWQAAAKQAVVERAAGEYDAWKMEEAEAWWGQKGNVS